MQECAEDHRGGTPTKELRVLCDELKRILDPRTFYLRYCPEAQITNYQLKSHCPIPNHGHSGTGKPSLSVDLRRGLYHCFSRGEGGDIIRFYEQMNNVSFPQAVHQLAAQTGLEERAEEARVVSPIDAPRIISASNEDQPLEPEKIAAICGRFLQICLVEEQTEGENYLARRGINRGTTRRAGVVYFPRRAYRRVMRKMLDEFAVRELQRSGLFNDHARLTFYRHRLIFPFFVANEPVYLQARTIAANVEPRWHNLRGSVPALYNVDALAALPSNSTIYVVEGFTDTLTLTAHNFAAVGLVGAAGLKPEWVSQLSRFRVILALDNDRAGRAAGDAYEELFTERGVRCFARLHLPTDVNDFFRQRATAALEFSLMTEAAVEESKSRGGCGDPQRL